jgi:pimeloyl-ACP methyl ester carboxylesterase
MRGAADVHDGVGGRGLARWLGLGAGQPELVAAGHDVHPLTLTGLVTAPPVLAEITLSTHVADIVSAIEYADLRDVVLVAHSYSGVPATIAANRIPDRISRVVYLAAVLALAGRSLLDIFRPPPRRRSSSRPTPRVAAGCSR